MKHNKILITIGLIGLIGLVAIAVFTFMQHRKTDDVKIMHSNFLENFEPNVQLTLNYGINDQDIMVEVKDTLNDQGSIQLEEKSIPQAINNYSVSYEIRNEYNTQTNLKFKISHGKIKSSLKGLPLKSSVVVTLDNNIIEQKIPTDWSGAISFDHSIHQHGEDAKRLCFIITHSKISTLCHTIPAVKEQIS